MKSGTYVGTKNYGDFGLISTGDYINPIIYSFKLKNTGKTLVLEKQLYLIVSDIELEYVKVSISGGMIAIRPQLSWDGNIWESEISKSSTITANNTFIAIPFKLKFNVDDLTEYFVNSDVNQLRAFKINLLYG